MADQKQSSGNRPSIEDDQCRVAENVEFFYSTCGERRLGCTAISLPVSITGNAALTTVTWMGRHLPTNDIGDAELWVFAQSLTAGTNLLVRRTRTAWSTVTVPDTITSTVPYGHQMQSCSVHGKLFLAYNSAQDRLHVWEGDSSSLERAGIAEPAAPSVANSAAAGTFATVRYYRVRFVKVDADGVVLKRSEPSLETSFTPDGAHTGAVVSRPALLNEAETHWEIEASLDNANFYRVSRELIATLTYTDTVAAGTGYANTAGTELSEDIGEYSLIPSVEFVTVDDDRLVMGGDYEDDDLASRVFWTPVNGDPGVGNDERLSLPTNPYIDLDGVEGGKLTGLSQGVSGYVFAFKRSRIYKLIRTTEVDHAYEPLCLTRSRGALRGSLVSAVDAQGQSALYYLDPSVGPSRLGSKGIEWCGYDVHTTWKTVVPDSTVPCHGVFYPDKQQIHWWVAINGSVYPNAKIILHVNRTKTTENGVRRGWSTVPEGDRIAAAHCSVMHSINVDSTDARSVTLVPFIGLTQWSVSGVAQRNLVQRCDVNNTDGAVSESDTDGYYRARVKTKPILIGGLLQEFEVLAGELLAAASAAAHLTFNTVKNFGKDEGETAEIDLTPDRNETYVLRSLNDLNAAKLQWVEFEWGDLRTDLTYDKFWQIVAVQFKVTPGASK